jgi:transposase
LETFPKRAEGGGPARRLEGCEVKDGPYDRSIAAKIGGTGQTLNEWMKQAERDSGRNPGLTTDMAARLKALERENRELRQASEILRKASAYFAEAELDRRFKP